METTIIKELQDLTYLKWSHARSSSGTAGTFLKSESMVSGKKIYYKLSDFDPELGVVGHECVNEIIVDRLLTVLGVEHLHYQLINARIETEGRIFTTYLCASEDFKERGESKTALDNYYTANKLNGESAYDFCARMGFADYIDAMLAIDFIIFNRDRHGANIEILRDARKHTLRIAPYFDHGLSLMFPCHSDSEVEAFDIMKDGPCNNFIGGRSCRDNLDLIANRKIFTGELKESDMDYILEGLDGVISEVLLERIRTMIMERYKVYESFREAKSV